MQKSREIKSDIATIKNTMECFNSRVEEAGDWFNELEDKVEKQTQPEHQVEKKIKKQEGSLREFWDNTKWSNICIIGVPEGQGEQKGLENLFEEITENFPVMRNKKVAQVQSPKQDESQKTHTKTFHNYNGKC